MKHIVHLTTVHLPFDTRIFQKECKTLAQAGYRVSLIAPHDKHEVVDGVEIIPLPRFGSRWRRMLLGPLTLYRLARATHADLYHFHDPEIMPVGVWLKWTTRARVIYDVHENYRQKLLSARGWIPKPARRLASFGVGLAEWLSSPSFDAFVCTAEGMMKNFPRARRVLVTNYPILERTSEAPDPRQYDANNHTLIYTGGWAVHRGAYELVQALALVKDPKARLIVLGRSIDRGEQEAASALSAYSRVDYLGMLPYDQLYEQMRGAAIGLVCNLPGHGFEFAQSNRLYEFMSAGLPAIASDFPMWREVVEGSDCGLLVDASQPAEIARAIDTLLSDPERRAEMGKRGCQAVLNKYNWGVEGQKLVELYDRLLHRDATQGG